jgi:putative aldouronate transport system permease protein
MSASAINTVPAMRAKFSIYRRQRALLFMFAPCVVWLLLFCYLPMGGAMIAFKDFRLSLGVFGSEWNGLDNFRALFEGGEFWHALKNTLTLSLMRLTLGFAAPITLALLLNEVRVGWFKRSVQTLTYLPHFFSWVILGGIFLLLFSQAGPINQSLVRMGLPPIPFFTEDRWFVALLVGSGIWQEMGYGAVIYLAALAGIPPEYYEAAEMDGASRWQRIRHITLPALVPTMVTLFILNLGGVLNGGFDQIYNLYNPMVYDVADIIDTFVLRAMHTMNFGVATAAGLFKSVVAMLLIVSVNLIARRLSKGENGVF